MLLATLVFVPSGRARAIGKRPVAGKEATKYHPGFHR